MTKEKPLLSIITVNYNNAEGLRKTMQSVLDLEFKDYEYIIIDGGSTDDSVSIINQFLTETALKDKISFWCSEKDSGIYNAMNKGLSHVHGTIVNMMNSGDCFVSDALRGMSDLVSSNSDSVLYGAVNQTKNGVYVNTYAHNPRYSLENGLCSQAVFVPAKLHEKLGNFDEQYCICADFDFFQRVSQAGYDFKFINRIVCDYDITGVSITQDSQRRKELKLIKEKYALNQKEGAARKVKAVVKWIIPYGLIKLSASLRGE